VVALPDLWAEISTGAWSEQSALISGAEKTGVAGALYSTRVDIPPLPFGVMNMSMQSRSPPAFVSLLCAAWTSKVRPEDRACACRWQPAFISWTDTWPLGAMQSTDAELGNSSDTIATKAPARLVHRAGDSLL
jgi:hypothetical protein